MEDTQDSKEDVGKMECEQIRRDKAISADPTHTPPQTNQSNNPPKDFKDGAPHKRKNKSNIKRSSTCAALSGVNGSFTQRAENILEHLNKQIKKCQDFITSPDNLSVVIWFPALKDKLVNFSELLQKYKAVYQRCITEIAEDFETKVEEGEKKLRHLIETHDRSPFSADNINQWLENKETELKILNDCKTADITVVKSQSELHQIINDPQINRVMCFTLTSPDDKDSFLTALKRHIESDHITPTDSLQSKPVKINQKVLIELQLYIAAKEANEDTEQTRFIAASVPDDEFPEFTVQFYYAGMIVSRNMKLEVKPDLPQIVQIKHNNVSVKWNHLQNKSIDRYVVEYRALDDDGHNTWKQITVNAHTCIEKFVLSDLEPATGYQLRYAACYNNSMSNFSWIIHFQTSSVTRPGRPSVTKLSRDTLRLTWLKAEADEDCPVLHYMVEYREAGLEGWSSVLTQGSECECTLTVPNSTCYRVRVSAVYGEQDRSKPSEETSVPVDVWTIDLSKRKSSILLEVLKLQTEKKPVELIDWTDDESEVRGFIQCLPYISQLRFIKPPNESSELWEKRKRLFILDLCLQTAVCQKETIETTVKMLLSSVNYEQCDFLLDLYSHVKDYESQTNWSLIPALQSIYQSSPAVWIINLSERKTSILLEVLKLQTEKKPVELIDWTDDESEVRGFIQCLPYISQLRFTEVFYENRESVVQFLMNLFTAASEFDTNTEEKYTKLLTSVCCYTTFPCDDDDFEYQIDRCDFLLDLCSHVKDYESQTGKSLLPALQSIYQSTPAVWIINLSERKTSILLEVLKLQTEKKPVKLIDWTDDESEVRGFIQCLPYISQLRNADKYIPSLCKVFGPKVNRDEVTPLLQALGFTVTLSEKLPSSTCRCVGRVLSLSSSKLNLTLKPQAISIRGVRRLFTHITHLQKLSLEDRMVMVMIRALRSCNDRSSLTIEELSLITKDSKQNYCRIVSSLISFLRRLSVQRLDLTECKIDAVSVTAMLCLQGFQTIRLSKETLQQLVSVVYEAQDDELTRCFLKKVSEDLTSCSLTWKVIQYLLQHPPLHLKLDFRKSKITCENIRKLVPCLDRIQLKRLTPSFILSIIMEIYESRSPQFVSGLLSSAENDINLKNKVLNSDQCSALCFTLQHCNTVKLNLFWTSIPEEELKRLLPLLNRVTQLSVDRQLLLKLLHCCSSSDDQQEAANLLLSALRS
ncbi:uncharacterized protein [Misgurnus anguillicaudatus]|uniref:uncharacterized protein isoform X2 n=1 Tax=Misgurnus anguillicaudatus TaxID=75329 RepID=UPI003CCF1AC4